MFLEIVVLKNFVNFTGKQLYWSLFLVKLQAFEFNKGIFLWNLWNFQQHLFLQNTSGGLLWIYLLKKFVYKPLISETFFSGLVSYQLYDKYIQKIMVKNYTIFYITNSFTQYLETWNIFIFQIPEILINMLSSRGVL